MKKEQKLSRNTRPYLYVCILVAIILATIGLISYAWFTDKKEYTGDLEMGTVKISVDNGNDNQDVSFNLSRAFGRLTNKVMPGDTISCNVRIKNIGSEPCYYLVCFVNDNAVLSANFNKDYYYSTTSSSTEFSNSTTHKLGKLDPNKNQTVAVELEISPNLTTGQNQSTEIKCSIFAIQQANLSESEAYELIQQMKSERYPNSAVINLYNEDGTPSNGNNSITSPVQIAYTDSTKSQFYLDATSLNQNLTNSSGEELYFYSTVPYSSTTSASKYIETTKQNNISYMNTSSTSKTDTSSTSYLAKLSNAQNYDLTYDLNNKIVYNTPNYGVNLYPVFLKPNYGNTDTSLNTYVKGTTPYLIISKDKISTSRAEFLNNTNIKAVVIPNTISTITEGTFVNCSNLKYVTFPTSNLTTLGYQSFCRTAIEELIIPDCIKNLNNSTNYAGAFSYNTNIKTVYLGKGIASLSAASFYNCSNLENIYFNNNLESIGIGVFNKCTKLSNVNLPNSLQMIGEQAFLGCSSLKTINLPNSLKSLNTAVFQQSGLTGEIGLPYQCEILGTSNSAFVEITGITGFYIKDANGNRITETTFTGQSGEITYLTNGDGCLYKKLDGNNIRLELFPGGYVNKEFRIGANVTQFRRFELENSYNVEKFIVDKNNEYFENDSYGVIYVKKQTTYDGRTFTKDMLLNCPTGATFTSYTMKDGVSGVYLFAARNLEHLTIPTNTTMTTIPGCCLQGANKLKTINSSVDGVFDLSGLNITEIGYKSFEFCYGLKEMILPASCTTIDNAAFRCSGITKLTTYATTKLTLNTGSYLESGKLLDKTGTYFENGVEKYKGLQNIYVLNNDLIAQYQNDNEWNTYLSKADGEDYKLNISVIA